MSFFRNLAGTAMRRYKNHVPATMWEKANERTFYSRRIRLKNILVAIDAWWGRHPVIVGVMSGIVIVAGLVAAVNLELGRPWF